MQYVETLIADGSVKPGGRLPTERAIADTVGCTRTEVRRALNRLESMGRLARHVGRGTFLMDRPDVARTDVRGTSPADLMAARMSWEPQVAMIAAAAAAAAAAEQDFEEMHRCLEGGDRSDGFDE